MMKFLFVFYKKTKDEYYLDKSQFWNMPFCDRNEVRRIWLKTKKLIQSGKIFKEYQYDKKESKLVLVLDSIQDPQNFGSLCRTALCFGIREIIIPKDHSAPTSGLVAKASAGAIEHLKIIRVTNLTRSIEELKKNEFWIYGTDLSKTATDITKINPGKKSAIVLGTEGKGIRRLVSEACDAHVRVPLQADFDSLNVAQAGAVLMYGFSQAMIE